MKKYLWGFIIVTLMISVASCKKMPDESVVSKKSPVNTSAPSTTNLASALASTEVTNLSATSSSVSAQKSIVLPPVRIASATIHGYLYKRYTFESAFSEADAVARVKVGNWLKEDLETQITYYEAEVLQSFKGNMASKFIWLQDGCSKGTYKNYPLFTHGNELLVFLKGSLDESPPEYWIMGAFTTLMDVAYDKSGARYYADPYGILGETIKCSKNYTRQEERFAEIYEQIVAKDHIVSEMSYTYPYIFAECDLNKIIENCLVSQKHGTEGEQK